jgi:hypothetical protein
MRAPAAHGRSRQGEARLDESGRLVAPPKATRANRVPRLSVRLARLAVDVDEVAQEIIAEPLSERDELWLAAPTAHLALALDWLQQALYETDRLDVSQSWAAMLRAAEDQPHDRTA